MASASAISHHPPVLTVNVTANTGMISGVAAGIFANTGRREGEIPGTITGGALGILANTLVTVNHAGTISATATDWCCDPCFRRRGRHQFRKRHHDGWQLRHLRHHLATVNNAGRSRARLQNGTGIIANTVKVTAIPA